jgi:high affinity Mn2+ porin
MGTVKTGLAVGATVALLILGAGRAVCQEPPAAAAPGSTDLPSWLPRLLGAQFTLTAQRLLPFAAPYSGPRSLESHGDTEETDTYGAYFGSQLTANLQAYLDVELARGHGVSHAEGLAGITNGDVIRQGSVNLGQDPYVARAFLRYVIPLAAATESLEHKQDQLPGKQATTRVELKFGKLALSDDLDQNRYANATRTQFTNWGLFNNTAWDYAADTRGYTYGLYAGWVHPGWTLRFETAQMPTLANGNVFDSNIREARGDNLELTLSPWKTGTVVRFLVFENHGRMGSYREAIDRALATGGVPDIVADDRVGRTKKGLGLNLEQPLADQGETGAFLRLGWSDGRNEDFVFTEADRHASAGLQLAGGRWRREQDRVAVALVLHGLSADHRDYLAAGGEGFLLGDGRLRYGTETIVETYYRFQCGKFMQVGPDYQHIWNPGFNRDRGPASVISLRLHAEY